MIYITGDCHREYRRFNTQNFPEQKGMTKEDYVIVCGDFGGVWSFEKGETRYSLKLLPFGGSCMMLGEDENESDPKAFNNKPVWARIAVVFAGPLFNFLLAMVLGIIIVHAVGFDSPTLTDVQPGFSAEEQGMQAGDVITKLNREPVVVYRDITIYMMLHPSDPVDVEFKRLAADGVTWEKHTVTLTPR